MKKASELMNREEGSAAGPLPIADAAAEPTPLERLQQRIARARTIEPTGRDRHCLDCFRRGRDAALRAIDTEE